MRLPPLLSFTCCLVLSGAAACSGSHVMTPLPEEVPNKPAHGVAWPVDTDLAIASGIDDTGMAWAHARGYLPGAWEALWQALGQGEICVDQVQVASYSIHPIEAEGFPIAFRIDNTVKNIITVTFSLTWRFHRQIVGDTWQWIVGSGHKTAGTSYIEALDYAMSFQRQDDGRIAFELVAEVRAVRLSEDDPRGYLEALVARLREVTATPP